MTSSRVNTSGGATGRGGGIPIAGVKKRGWGNVFKFLERVSSAEIDFLASGCRQDGQDIADEFHRMVNLTPAQGY